MSIKEKYDQRIFLNKSAQKLMTAILHIQLSSKLFLFVDTISIPAYNSVFCQHLKEDVLLIVQPF